MLIFLKTHQKYLLLIAQVKCKALSQNKYFLYPKNCKYLLIFISRPLKNMCGDGIYMSKSKKGRI